MGQDIPAPIVQGRRMWTLQPNRRQTPPTKPVEPTALGDISDTGLAQPRGSVAATPASRFGARQIALRMLRLPASPASTLSVVLCMLIGFSGACAVADTEPECTRQCGAGLQCKRVEDPYIQGSFSESCVPIATGCSPACGEGYTCQGWNCVKTCAPECADYQTCRDGVCDFPEAGLGCSQLLACIADCDKDDCVAGCEAAGNAIGSNLLAVFDQCIERYACVDTSCVELNCLNEYRACLGLPPTCVPECESGFACSANAECVPIGGEVCNPPCPAGQTCVDQRCQLGGGCSGNETACVGNLLQLCENGQPRYVDCPEIAPQCGCAFVAEQGRHDCVCGTGGGIPCNPPCPFPTQCINGVCE